ncbi:MAG: cob(I)yrinic acid a,c-diamide adenosyltransferase [Bacteroidetes bacterium]|nr:MAG: cob(I)yrinic acid a,c-diamide adenosyltransferase [Bacteroidota bacterium]
MKIYTKKGDGGTTQLIGGTRVPKHTLRIEAYGTVDELNSFIGVVRDQDIQTKHQERLIEIQDRLFTMGSLLAAEPGKSKMQLPEIHTEDLEYLEKAIDEMDDELPPMKSFILPGGHPAVSHCHVARCVCRRAERITTALNEHEAVPEIILQYLNRLSDYLFVLCRKLSQELGAKEQPWKPRL